MIARVAAAGLVAIVSFLLAEDFVGHLWYSSRQHNLAGQLGSAVAPAEGQKAGQLQIPTIGLNAAVVEGDSPTQLRSGPGHAPGTPYPTQRGNTVIFGHRRDWGAPFAHLPGLAVGTKIYLQGRSATSPPLVYAVIVVRIAAAGDRSVVAPSGDFRLTLVTDAGGRTSGNELVVVARSGTPASAQQSQSRPNRIAARPAAGTGDLLQELLTLLLAVGAGTGLLLALRQRFDGDVRTAVLVSTPLFVGAALAAFLVVDQVVYGPLA